MEPYLRTHFGNADTHPEAPGRRGAADAGRCRHGSGQWPPSSSLSRRSRPSPPINRTTQPTPRTMSRQPGRRSGSRPAARPCMLWRAWGPAAPFGHHVTASENLRAAARACDNRRGNRGRLCAGAAARPRHGLAGGDLGGGQCGGPHGRAPAVRQQARSRVMLPAGSKGGGEYARIGETKGFHLAWRTRANRPPLPAMVDRPPPSQAPMG